jgi:hypothetical protein
MASSTTNKKTSINIKKTYLMSKQYLAKEFSTLPPYIKGVIAIATIGVTGFLIYKAYKGIQTFKYNRDNRQEDKAWNKELDSQQQRPTLSQVQLMSMSTQLFVAMDGYGTDEALIYSVFEKLNNNADFAALVSAYGIKEISSGRFNPAPNFKGNLIGALSDELSASELARINQILEQKFITYRV